MEFINLKKQYQVLKPVIDEKIQDIMADARFIGGREIDEFEKRFAEYIGRKHCVSCGNGTDALFLSYLVYGVGKGDAVFCPDMTFIASIEPACMLGATPIFVDIEENSYNLSPEFLEEKIKQITKEGKLNPKAVIMVDFLGNPADANAIEQICERYGLILIEDAAQATGAVYKDRKCGSIGDISCTSFFPSKPLGCYGDGGAILTDNDDIADLLRSYKMHGKGSSKYDNVRIGVNSRLDAIQAAVLLAKLEILDKEIDGRQRIAKRYDNAFSEMFQIPAVEEGCRCSYAQYVLLAKNKEDRTKILETMKIAEVPSLLYYPKEMHRMDAFHLNSMEQFPNASRYARCNFGIPFSPYLTDEEQDMVIHTIKSAL